MFLSKNKCPGLVSWDMDGTLYAVGPMLCRAFLKLISGAWGGQSRRNWTEFRELCYYHYRFERIRKTGGHFNPAAISYSINRFMALQSRWYAGAITECGLRAGIPQVLRYLQELNLSCVVFSDYQVDYKLQALGLEGVFQACYEGIHLGAIKPAPDAFLKMAADFSISPEEILHVGNQETDAAAADAAGSDSLILGKDFRSYSELLKGGKNKNGVRTS